MRHELARDLGVHALAGVVEGRGAEPGHQERRQRRRRQDGGEQRRGPAAQVRDTRNTPSTMKPIPVQRAGVTGSFRIR